METEKEHRYRRAKQKIGKLKSFYDSFLAYWVIVPILAYLNYETSDFPWVLFPAIGWGIGLVLLRLCVMGHHPIFGKDWEKRKIQELMSNNKF